MDSRKSRNAVKIRDGSSRKGNSIIMDSISSRTAQIDSREDNNIQQGHQQQQQKLTTRAISNCNRDNRCSIRYLFSGNKIVKQTYFQFSPSKTKKIQLRAIKYLGLDLTIYFKIFKSVLFPSSFQFKVENNLKCFVCFFVLTQFRHLIVLSVLF